MDDKSVCCCKCTVEHICVNKSTVLNRLISHHVRQGVLYYHFDFDNTAVKIFET